MTAKEIEEYLQPATEQLIQELFDKNLPVTYRDTRCPSSSHYIHEYEDGRQYLVLFNANDRNTEIIQELK